MSSTTGSIPCACSAARIVGNRTRHFSSPKCRASSHTCSAPDARIEATIALATTSRGARSPSGCWPVMNRAPSSSTRNAPSPRTASLTSGCWPLELGPSHSTVGWNWTNSRSRTTAPDRSAAATPSPVDTAGLFVVDANTCPMPPVASTTDAAACTEPTPSRLSLAHDVQRDARDRAGLIVAVIRSSSNACSIDIDRRPRRERGRRPSARSISSPVASPPACAMRSR